LRQAKPSWILNWPIWAKGGDMLTWSEGHDEPIRPNIGTRRSNSKIKTACPRSKVEMGQSRLWGVSLGRRSRRADPYRKSRRVISCWNFRYVILGRRSRLVVCGWRLISTDTDQIFWLDGLGQRSRWVDLDRMSRWVGLDWSSKWVDLK